MVIFADILRIYATTGIELSPELKNISEEPF